MEDFNYVHSNCFEITMELSCCKYPKAKELQKEWELNKESLILYMEATHAGIHGNVFDLDTNDPISQAVIEVTNLEHNVTSNRRGQYWRLLVPGVYQVRVSAFGYESSDFVEVTIDADSGRRTDSLDFHLQKRGLKQAISLTAPASPGSSRSGSASSQSLAANGDTTKAKEKTNVASLTLRPDGFLTEPQYK